MERLAYKLTEPDLLEFNLYHAAHSPARRLSNLRFRWLIPIVYLGFGGYLAYQTNYQAAAMMAIVAVIWMIFAPLWLKLRFRRYFRFYVRKRFADAIDRPMSLELTGDGIRSRTPHTESLHPYAELAKIVEQPNHTYIYVGQSMALVVPHDQVGQAERTRFLEQLRSRMMNKSA